MPNKSKLAQLKPSFSELSNEARLELILSIRASRRISKRPQTEQKTRTSSKSKLPTKKSAAALISALSPEAILELLATLGTEVQNE